MIIGNCPVCGAKMRVGTDMTNADRVRSMTDEELAELFMSFGNCLDEVSDEQCAEFGNCQECWLSWIGTEAKAE